MAAASPSAQAADGGDGQAQALDAVVRALGFLESAPRNGDFIVGVVYDADTPGAARIADETQAQLEDLPGPRRTRLRARVYDFDGLLASTDHVHALLLTPGVESESARIAEFIRERRVLSVSNDPACFEAGACVLMVNADRDVEIVLDTQLAGQIGAQFSTVFTMMVTRR